MSRETICGIYSLKFTESELMYIGSSIDINRRYSQHCTNLRKGKHHNYKMQEHYNTYNTVPHIDIIEKCLEISIADREKYWIAEKDTLKNGFNLTPGDLKVLDNMGRHFNAKHSDDTYVSILEALAFTNDTHKAIGTNLGVHKRVVDSVKEAQNHKYLSVRYPELWQQMLLNRTKTRNVTLVSPSGELYTITYGNGNNFAREQGLDGNAVNALIRGLHKHHRGWTLWQPQNLQI